MAVDGVPFAIDQTALHNASVDRVLAYAAVGGSEGVVGPADLFVEENDIPDGNVIIFPGAGSITCRALGQAYQSYIFRAPTATTVAINPTSSSGPRSDMIVARVENPYLAGEPWSIPLDPENGPYVRLAVIENVSGTATKVNDVDATLSAIPLARVDIPVSTGTITQSMIKDLRWFNQALTHEVHMNTHCDNMQVLLNTETNFVHFPNQANYDIVVPDWATHLQITATFDPAIVYGAGTTHGVHAGWRFQVTHGADPAINTVETDFDMNMPQTAPSQGDYRTFKTFADRIALTDAMKGDVINIKPQMKMIKTFVNHIDDLRCNRGTNMIVTLNFRQTAGGA
jgi:hypothetical protein